MKIYKIASPVSEKQKAFLEMFDMQPEDLHGYKTIEIYPPEQKIITLKLYRGFNHLPENMTLNPQTSEQGLLWFTHEYISRNYDPIEYATSHGKYLLTYPLQCIKHYQKKKLKNGNITEQIPENIEKQTNPYENCRFYMGIELPQGWFFTYKTEKFIGCSIPLQINPSMIQLSKTIIKQEIIL